MGSKRLLKGVSVSSSPYSQTPTCNMPDPLTPRSKIRGFQPSKAALSSGTPCDDGSGLCLNAQHNSHYTYVATEHVKYDMSHRGAEFLILFNVLLSSFAWLITTALDNAGLEYNTPSP